MNEEKNTKSLKSRIRSFFTQEFFTNSIVHWLFLIIIFLNIVNWVVLGVFIRPVDFHIILHYNVYFGVDLIGDWWHIYLITLTATMFLVVNFFLAWNFFRKKERIASYMLLLASLIIQAGMLIATASIILINS